MRINVARITDPSSVSRISPINLMALIRDRAPRLAAQMHATDAPTADELLGTLRGVRPEDDADSLLQDLHDIQLVAQCEAAEELILDRGIPLNDISIGDALALAAVTRRREFETIVDHATVLSASQEATFTSFAPAIPRSGLVLLARHAAETKGRCETFFAELGQGPHCEVRFYEEGGEEGFLIDHAGARRTERLINEIEQPEVRRIRPCRHDMVLLNRQSNVLRILARSERERQFYSQVVGEILVQDPGFFMSQEAYVLDAIAQSGYAQVLQGLVSDTIERVTLRELRIVGEDDVTTRHNLTSKDVMRSVENDQLNLDGYIITSAGFAIVPRIRNGRRCFRLTVHKGNRRKSTAPWNNETTEAFIRQLRLRREVVV